LWTAFGKEATTAAATSATSKAFAALAAERDALRHFNLARQEQRRSLVAPSSTWFRASSDHDYAIELLSKAAEYWFEADHALEEHAITCPDEATTSLQNLRTLIGYALEQRLRIWTIAQHLLVEQVALYQQHYGSDR